MESPDATKRIHGRLPGTSITEGRTCFLVQTICPDRDILARGVMDKSPWYSGQWTGSHILHMEANREIYDCVKSSFEHNVAG